MFVRRFGSGRFCAYVVLDEADGCLHRVVAVWGSTLVARCGGRSK